MLISFVIWTACSAVFDSDGNKGAGIAVVVFIFVYVSDGAAELLLKLTTSSSSITISVTRRFYLVTQLRFCHTLSAQRALPWK